MPELISRPWDVSESDFPAAGTPASQLRFLLNYAVLAPSRHNVQPWLFKVEDHHVELYADHPRSLSVTDPQNRAITISCGAALTNLILAIRYFGSAPVVEICAHPCEPQLLARVSLEKGMPATLEERRLFHAIPARRTNEDQQASRVQESVIVVCQ